MIAGQSRRNLLGIASLCTGVLVFSTQDAIIKGISADYSVTQAIVTRCLVAVPLLALFVHWETGIARIRSPHFWVLTLRGLFLLSAYTTYYLAFPALPLADAVALFFTAPLMITVLAGPILGERITVVVVLATAIGFAGVIVMQRPGSGLFEPAALLSLISALFYAISALAARKLGVTETAAVMAFYQNGAFLIGATIIAAIIAMTGITHAQHPSLNFLVRPWHWPSARDLGLMMACGAIASLGTLLLTNAYRLARASMVSVFEYTGLLWAPLWGFLFFAEVPAWWTIIGALMIAGAGILTLANPTPPAKPG